MTQDPKTDPSLQVHLGGPRDGIWGRSGRFPMFGGTSPSYYRARYYDSSIGRFLSEDPVGLTAGPSLYRYAMNSAPSYSDPSGLFEIKTDINKYKYSLWDPTNWGLGGTTIEVSATGQCVQDCKGWHINYSLKVTFNVNYSSQSVLKHELEHVSIVIAGLQKARPKFEGFETPHFKYKADCDRNLNRKILGGPGSDLDNLLNSLNETQRFSEAQSEPEPWFQRLWRKIFF